MTTNCTADDIECGHWFREDDKCTSLAVPHGEHCTRHGGDRELDAFVAEHDADDCCPVHHEQDETLHLIDGDYVQEAA